MQIITVLESYIQNVLDQKIKVHPWGKKAQLPFFLIDSYDFYKASFLNKMCLFMVAKKGIELTSVQVRNHLEQVLKKWDGLCIFVQESVSSYNRKRLIAHHIPFIIPDSQLYLPDLGIDLREYFRSVRQPKKSFSPATQAVIIYALQQKKPKLTPTELAKALNYTPMTMSRALDELEDTGIGIVNKVGKERFWYFQGSRHELFEQTRPFLRSPVKTKAWIKNEKLGIIAGLSALADRTLLNPPTLPVYAIDWETWNQSGIEALPSSEEATAEFEIWHYDPQLFAKDAIIDPFSLYLSLADSGDERVELALEKLLEQIKW